METRLRAERPEQIGIPFRAGLRDILPSIPSRPALTPTHPTTQWVLGVSPGIMRQERKADQSTQSSADVKNANTLNFHGVTWHKLSTGIILHYIKSLRLAV
jgi:hypothetical protein